MTSKRPEEEKEKEFTPNLNNQGGVPLHVAKQQERTNRLMAQRLDDASTATTMDEEEFKAAMKEAIELFDPDVTDFGRDLTVKTAIERLFIQGISKEEMLTALISMINFICKRMAKTLKIPKISAYDTVLSTLADFAKVGGGLSALAKLELAISDAVIQDQSNESTVKQAASFLLRNLAITAQGGAPKEASLAMVSNALTGPISNHLGQLQTDYSEGYKDATLLSEQLPRFASIKRKFDKQMISASNLQLVGTYEVCRKLSAAIKNKTFWKMPCDTIEALRELQFKMGTTCGFYHTLLGMHFVPINNFWLFAPLFRPEYFDSTAPMSYGKWMYYMTQLSLAWKVPLANNISQMSAANGKNEDGRVGYHKERDARTYAYYATQEPFNSFKDLITTDSTKHWADNYIECLKSGFGKTVDLEGIQAAEETLKISEQMANLNRLKVTALDPAFKQDTVTLTEDAIKSVKDKMAKSRADKTERVKNVKTSLKTLPATIPPYKPPGSSVLPTEDLNIDPEQKAIMEKYFPKK